MHSTLALKTSSFGSFSSISNICQMTSLSRLLKADAEESTWCVTTHNRKQRWIKLQLKNGDETVLRHKGLRARITQEVTSINSELKRILQAFITHQYSNFLSFKNKKVLLQDCISIEKINKHNRHELLFVFAHVTSFQYLFAGLRMKYFLYLLQKVCFVHISGEEGDVVCYWRLTGQGSMRQAGFKPTLCSTGSTCAYTLEVLCRSCTPPCYRAAQCPRGSSQ